jgi:hypothetical protein
MSPTGVSGKRSRQVVVTSQPDAPGIAGAAGRSTGGSPGCPRRPASACRRAPPSRPRASVGSSAGTGRLATKVVPRPSVLSTWICPPWGSRCPRPPSCLGHAAPAVPGPDHDAAAFGRGPEGEPTPGQAWRPGHGWLNGGMLRVRVNSWIRRTVWAPSWAAWRMRRRLWATSGTCPRDTPKKWQRRREQNATRARARRARRRGAGAPPWRAGPTTGSR